MNRLAILGIVVIGAGSYLASIERLKVLGFITVAVGTFMVAYGDRRESKADSRRVEEKLTEIRYEIASAKEAALSPQEAKKLDSIGQEFREWASDFVRNRDRKKLEVTQVQASALEAQFDRSDVWRPVIEFFLETVRQSVHAYAGAAQVNASVQFPPLPSNLFDRKMSYEGTVLFSENAKWKVRLKHTDSKLLEFPMLIIDLVRASAQIRLAYVMSLDRDDQFVTVSLSADVVPRLPGIEGSFPFGDYQKGFGYSIRRLVEAQLLSL